LGALAPAVPGGAEENPALVEALQIMRDRDMIDDAKHAELIAKNHAWEASHPSLLSRLEWSGDVRGRLENFWYSEDDFGLSDPDTQDRTRGRYRLRVGARAKINDWFAAGFRVASGDGSNRSTNESFGAEDDFIPDPIFIDQAWVELGVPKRHLPETMALKTIVGKQANPFLWKNGKDYMVWDQDIMPEGVALQVSGMPIEMLSLYGNAGYFIADENGGGEDPHVLGFQGGFGLSPLPCFEFGTRVSWYDWRSINDAFLDRAANFGSVVDDEDGFSVGEVAAYTRIKAIENWPILIYGHIAQNLEADSPAGVPDEDLGWGGAIEIGDKKRLLIGGGYYHVEANFSPAQFTDSDLFDGYTNREGFTAYVTREIFANTELTVTMFHGDAIDDDDAFDIEAVTGTDTPSAERYRLQTDIMVKF
jgi:hypothetical protein